MTAFALPHPALLPAGLHDLLAPEASREAAAVETLMAAITARGFDRVKPPLVEFEETLRTGAGEALSREMFRLLDPVSQRMMCVRADMTLQVARIAAVRLAHLPRPLRLSYAGQVLRVNGTQLRPERQFGQVGAELIGSLRAEADAEVILTAAAAVGALGIDDVSVDLCLPTLVPELFESFAIAEAQRRAFREALDHKDGGAVAAMGGPLAELLARLIRISGQAETALPSLAALSLPPTAEADRARLLAVGRILAAEAPRLLVTVDLVEWRGFEYQTGVSFTLFARDVRGELGRGGRYRSAFPGPAIGGEPGTGFTLYTDTLLRAVQQKRPAATPRPRLFLPHGTDAALADQYRREGYVALCGLEPTDDIAAEARRLGCSHWLDAASATVRTV